MRSIIKFTSFFFLLSHIAFAQTDFLGISSITLDGQAYGLKWSANNVYQARIIEEYLLPGESFTRYNTKLILEYIRSGKTIENMTEAKLADLANEKEEGRAFDYKKLESADPNEIILECMIGDVRDGVTHNIEWNLYRYISYTEGVILFVMSKRAYEEINVSAFMQEVNANRLNWINAIVNYKLPAIAIKK